MYSVNESNRSWTKCLLPTNSMVIRKDTFVTSMYFLQLLAHLWGHWLASVSRPNVCQIQTHCEKTALHCFVWNWEEDCWNWLLHFSLAFMRKKPQQTFIESEFFIIHQPSLDKERYQNTFCFWSAWASVIKFWRKKLFVKW